MKKILILKNIVVLALISSFSAIANSTNIELAERIAVKLNNMSDKGELVIQDNQVRIEFEDEELVIDENYLQELDELGLLNTGFVARDGARCGR